MGYSKTSVQQATSLGNLNDVSITSVADTQVLTYNSSSGKWKNAAAGGGGGSPGGSTTYIQYNNADSFGGISTFTFDGSNINLTGGNFNIVPAVGNSTLNITGSLEVSGATSDAIILRNDDDTNPKTVFIKNILDNASIKFEPSGGGAPTYVTTSGNFWGVGPSHTWGSNEHLTFDLANTRLGIGTDSPGAPLHVNTTANAYGIDLYQSAQPVMRLVNNNAAGNAELRMYAGANTTAVEKIRLEADGDTFFNGGDVGIGTGSPTRELDVVGKMGLDDGNNNVFIGTNAGDTAGITNSVAMGWEAGKNNSGSANVLIGYTAGQDMTSASENVFIGSDAGRNVTTGGEQIAIGRNALAYNVTGNRNIAIGPGAGAQSGTDTLSNSILIGLNAGSNIADGTSQFIGIGASVGQNYGGGRGIGIGDAALGGDLTNQDSSSAYNIAMGGETMRKIAGKASKNIVIGFGEAAKSISGSSTSEGSENVGMGYAVLRNITTGSNNIALGYQGAYGLTSGSDNVIIGSQAGYTAPYIRKSVVIGNEAMSQGAASSQFNTIMGYQANYKNLSNEGGNTIIGYQAGYWLGSGTGGLGGRENTLIGVKAGYNIGRGARNVCIGYDAGSGLIDDDGGNFAVGYEAMSNNGGVGILTGGGNIALGGFYAGRYLSGSSTENIILGGGLGRNQAALSNSNIGIGNDTLTAITATEGTSADNISIGKQNLNSLTYGGGNIALGRFALNSLNHATVYQERNVAIGQSAGTNLTTGSNNLYLGYAAGPAGATEESDKLYIANSSGTPLISGDFSAGYVGIGGTPTEKLHVFGGTSDDVAKFVSTDVNARITLSDWDANLVLMAISGSGVGFSESATLSDGVSILNSKIGIGQAPDSSYLLAVGGSFTMGSSVTLIENTTLGTISGTAFQYGISEATYITDVAGTITQAALILTNANFWYVKAAPGSGGAPAIITTTLPDGSTETGIKVTISQRVDSNPEAALSVAPQGSDVIYEGASNSVSATVAIPSFRGANKTFLTIAAGVWVVID